MRSKRVVAAMIAGVLSLGTFTGAIAAMYTPSKTTNDLSTATTSLPGVSLNADKDSEKYIASQLLANDELKKLAAADNPAAYFGKAAADIISSILGVAGDKVAINEFGPFVVEGYDASKGDGEFTMKFPTKYAENEKVAFMIGILNPDGSITWIVFEGVGQADGGIKFTVDAETLTKVSEAGAALYAVASIDAA